MKEMKFVVSEALIWSDWHEEIEINTIEELKKLDEKNGNHGLIINFSVNNCYETPTIIIYNGYIE